MNLTHLQPLDNSGGVGQSDAATERAPGAVLGVDHLVPLLLGEGVLLNVLGVSPVVIVIIIAYKVNNSRVLLSSIL